MTITELIALLSVVLALATILGNIVMQNRRLNHERKLASKGFAVERELASRQFAAEVFADAWVLHRQFLNRAALENEVESAQKSVYYSYRFGDRVSESVERLAHKLLMLMAAGWNPDVQSAAADLHVALTRLSATSNSVLSAALEDPAVMEKEGDRLDTQEAGYAGCLLRLQNRIADDPTNADGTPPLALERYLAESSDDG